MPESAISICGFQRARLQTTSWKAGHSVEGNPAPAPWRGGTAKSESKKAKGKRQEIRAGRLCLALVSAPQFFGVDSLVVSDPKSTAGAALHCICNENAMAS